MQFRTLVLGLSTALLLAGGAAAAPMMTDGVLTDENGMTLYIFDKDAPGVTNCYEQCAINWPPYIAEEGAMAEDPFSLVERNDGTMQWAHDGWPLYYWKDDVMAGDMTGDGVGGVWHVVKE